jgi:uncharacterized protein (UPF0335 family)
MTCERNRKMSENRLGEIKEKLAKEVPDHLKKEIQWLIERVEKLEAEKRELKGAVEFLKKELQYQDYQGEVM